MDARQERELFEKWDVTKAVFYLAFPTVAGQIILVIYNMADTFFVGLAGNDATIAAVTVCMPAFMFLSAISNLFGIGGASVISRALGAKERERVKLTAAFSFWGCLAVTALYCAMAFVLKDIYVDLLGGTNPAVHKSAVLYLMCTVAAGGIPTSIGVLFSHLIRSEGRSFQASIGIALGGILNIILDPIFMYRILPPGNEALGAAIATLLSNVIALLYFMIVLLCIRKNSSLAFFPSGRMLGAAVRRPVLSAGLPACMMTLMENISYAVLDKLMSLEGLPMQTGIGVAKKVNMLAHCIVRGIAQGSLPLIGYNYAAKNLQRMKDSVRVAHRIAVCMALLCMGAYLVFARQLIGIFIHHASTSLDYGMIFLRILCIGGPFSASAYTFISFFQAVGSTRRSFFLAILRKGVIDIPLMFILGALLPVYGIVLATPLADALCCLEAHRMFHHYLAVKVGFH